MTCPHPPDSPSPSDLSERPLPYQVFRAFHQLLKTNRLLMMRRISEAGAHPGQTFCLRELASTDGITQSELADRLRVTRPTVTVMLQKMEKAGLIERRVDEHDHRYTRIFLTDAGRALHQQMHDEFERFISDVISPLPERDQKELVRLLSALNDNMIAALADPAELASDTL